MKTVVTIARIDDEHSAPAVRHLELRGGSIHEVEILL